jgi:hypothetical protein
MAKRIQAAERAERRARKVWERCRPAWTRNETTRWLNERSALVLAWLRRKDPARAPAYSAAMGRWLQENRPAVYAAAHKNLSQLGGIGAPENIELLQVLP